MEGFDVQNPDGGDVAENAVVVEGGTLVPVPAPDDSDNYDAAAGQSRAKQVTIEEPEPDESDSENEFGRSTAQVHKIHHPPAVDMHMPTLKRLKHAIVRRRRLRQYFQDQHLYREKKKRKVMDDELFLDLIIVAIIANLGHELRDEFEGWHSIEKFFLLFQVVWYVWRDTAYYINMFGIEGDFSEKWMVMAIMVGLVNIGLSSNVAFSSAITWTALSCCFTSLFMQALTLLCGAQSTKINSAKPWRNTIVGYSLLGAVSTLPLFVGAFLSSSRAVKICYWCSCAIQVARSSVGLLFLRKIAQRFGQTAFPAINIEVFTEKFSLITLIVLGEGLLSMLSASSLAASEHTVKAVCVTGILGLAVTYAMQTFYFNVDQCLLRGAVHSIRYRSFFGVTWVLLHLLYHSCLVLGASGLGRVLLVAAAEDIIAGEAGGGEQGAVHLLSGVVRSELDTSIAGTYDRKYRWLLCGGYGGALMIGVVFSMLHNSGPLAVSKWPRLVIRVVVVTASILTTLPLLGGSLPTLWMLGVLTLIIFLLGAFEFLLVEVDRVRAWWFVDYDKRLKGMSGDLTSLTSSDSLSTSDSVFRGLTYQRADDKHKAQQCSKRVC